MPLTLTVDSIAPAGRSSLFVRLAPSGAGTIPPYDAGQYALLRTPDGVAERAFSIASAPAETARVGSIELYATRSDPGTAAFFFREGAELVLAEINGSFTLLRHAAGVAHVLMLATGTGLAPFRSMIVDAALTVRGRSPRAITLFHSHRMEEDLSYREELQRIMDARDLDFWYVPTITRPESIGAVPPSIGVGRVTGLLASVTSLGTDATLKFPAGISLEGLRDRCRSVPPVVMVCGNERMVEEVRALAARAGLTCVGEGD